MSPPPDDLFAIFPFDLLLTTFVAAIVSIVLIIEQEDAEPQEREQLLQRFAVLVSSTAHTNSGARRRDVEEEDYDEDKQHDGDDGDTQQAHRRKRKRRVVFYDHARTRASIYQDYLGPQPIFNAREFQCVFRISCNVYDQIKEEVSDQEFYSVRKYDFLAGSTSPSMPSF